MENTIYSGKFKILPDTDVAGSLTIAGPNSSLHVWGEGFAPIDDGVTVTGYLQNLRKVSLSDCWPSGRTWYGIRSDSEETWHCTLHPGLIVIGNEHLLPNDKEIVEANFTFDDAATLFYDRSAFGIVHPHEDESRASLLEQIGELKNRKIESGPHPIITYFSGKSDIVSVDTAMGKISVSRRIETGFGGPDGIGIKNEINTKIKFPEPVDSDHATRSVRKLLWLFEIIIGRPQNTTKLSFFKGEERQRAEPFEVIQCGFPIYERDDEERYSDHDLLINPIQRQEEFSRIVVNWLDRYGTWEDARSRFFNGFFKQKSYDIDRLVGAANMFDILPDSALPPRTEVSAEHQVSH